MPPTTALASGDTPPSAAGASPPGMNPNSSKKLLKNRGPSLLERFVLSPRFDGVMGILVGLNALSMAVEYQLPQSDLDRNWIVFQAADFTFQLRRFGRGRRSVQPVPSRPEERRRSGGRPL